MSTSKSDILSEQPIIPSKFSVKTKVFDFGQCNIDLQSSVKETFLNSANDAYEGAIPNTRNINKYVLKGGSVDSTDAFKSKDSSSKFKDFFKKTTDSKE